MKRTGLWSMTTFLVASIFATAAMAKAAGVDLTGVIRDSQGKPLAGATILVSTAGVKTGYSTFCPSCYADCAKKAQTSEDGRFIIADLSPDLRFSMTVAAPGYQPRMTRRIDPAKLMLLMQLSPLDLDKLDPSEYVTGKVVDETGQPVAHAVVETVHGDVKGEGGSMSDLFQEFVVTDAKGDFVITSKQHLKIIYVTLRVKARGYAPHVEAQYRHGSPALVIRLNRGVTVSGVLMHGDRPVPTAEVGLVQKSRQSDVFIGEQRIGTDAQGRFLFTNITGNQDYFLYSRMDSVKHLGATQAVLVHLKEPGSHLEAGALRIQGGHSLTGKVVLDDAGRIPPHTKIMLSREEAWDSQHVELDSTGRFAFQGLPAESYSLSLYFPGYAISELNPSLDRFNNRSLIGRVDQDIRGLSIWMERQSAGKKPDFHAQFRAAQQSGWKQDEIEQQPLRGFTPP